MTVPSLQPPPPSANTARVLWLVVGLLAVILVVLLVIATRGGGGTTTNAVSAPADVPRPADVPSVSAPVPSDSLIEPSGSPQSVAAAAPAASSQDAADFAYLAVLGQHDIAYSSQAAAIAAAHSTCDFLAVGGTTAQAGIDSMNAGYSAQDAGVIVGAQIGAYCPQFSGR